KDLFVLINGLDMWISEEKNDLENWKNLWVKTVGFDFMSSLDFHHKMQTHEKPIILDIRPEISFLNQDTLRPYSNRGHIKGAVNIPLEQLEHRWEEIKSMKQKEVIVYTYSGSPEVYQAAQILKDKGFKKVSVLTGGFLDLRWKAANINGYQVLNE